MASAFEFANTFTARWEGGYIDHPNDPGGATNYGVSLRWIKDDGIDVNGDGRIDIADIHALTPDLAAVLFKKHFWDLLRLDSLPPLAAIVTYDAAVNTGRGQTAKFLQRACNGFPGASLAVDGAIGPKTFARASELATSPASDLTLALSCIAFREAFHNQLCHLSHSQYWPRLLNVMFLFRTHPFSLQLFRFLIEAPYLFRRRPECAAGGTCRCRRTLRVRIHAAADPSSPEPTIR